MRKRIVLYLLLIILGLSISFAYAEPQQDTYMNSIKGEINFAAKEASEYGTADTIVDGQNKLYDFLDIEKDNIKELKHDIKTDISLYINNVYISTLLISLGIIGTVAEIFIPGFGAFGSVGILSFTLFFAGKFIGGHTQWGLLILFIAGIILLLIEASIPGFGVPGITGILCIVLSLLLSSTNIIIGTISLFAALTISTLALIAIFKYMPRKRLLKGIILRDEQKVEKGYRTARNEKDKYKDAEGISLTFLRPTGIALLNNERVNVISNGEYIEKDTKIKVINIEGNKIIVKSI